MTAATLINSSAQAALPTAGDILRGHGYYSEAEQIEHLASVQDELRDLEAGSDDEGRPLKNRLARYMQATAALAAAQRR